MADDRSPEPQPSRLQRDNAHPQDEMADTSVQNPEEDQLFAGEDAEGDPRVRLKRQVRRWI